ncbi:SurA N-terminal domain-containing protein [Ferrimonas balearica]|uniref:SurA N-terminal domain-containing protein n=1 Tax=Ferrimonas balearica TaxID=44012 RepID=UPI001C953E66|nr:SurA N-terminal domain-containing protein [Ferrimonas balearica]MBY5979898.1 SurA N-terminal domain-containing protein [Ferrimonas balearica]
MLEKIREGSQGVAAKIILGAVILSFALTGVYSYLGTNSEMLAAEVNGEEITRYDLDQAFQNEQARMRAQLGEMFDSLSADPTYMAGLRQSVLDRLIAERLIDQKVADLGLRVSDDQIQQAIVAMPEFQVDGKFDNARYQAVLRQNNLSGVQLRDMLRRDMSRQQLVVGLLGSEFVTDAEAQALTALQQQTRDLRYLLVSQADYNAGIEVSDSEISDFYQANQARFATPEEVSVEYVELAVSDLAGDVSVTDEEAKAFYDSQANAYQQPERRLAAHMLFEGDDAQARAEAALARVRAGEAFAAVAAEASDDTFTAENGGELDWMTPGQMDPAFDAALFALQEGETSDVIKTEYGYQIVNAKKIEAATQRPFDEVKASIIATLQADKAQTEFYGLQQKLADVSFQVPDSLVETAEAVGGEVKTTEMFSRNNAPAPMDNPRALAAAFSDSVLLDGMNSEVVQIDNGHILVLRVKAHQAAGTETLEQVKERIRAQLVTEKASDKAMTEAAAIESAWQAGTEPTDVIAVAGVGRFGQPDLDPTLVQSVFTMAKPVDGSVFSHFRLPSGDIAIVALDKVTDGSAEAELVGALKGRLAQQMGEADYRSLIDSLRADAEILYLDRAEANPVQ